MPKDRQSRNESAANGKNTERLTNDIRSLRAEGVGIGKVINSGVGTYSVEVQTAEGNIIPCVIASKAYGSTFGYSDGTLPKEGSAVIYVEGADASKLGYIIGIVPGVKVTFDEEEAGSEESTTQKILQLSTLVGGPNKNTETAYSDLIADEDSKLPDMGAFMPFDVFPGEFTVLNEHGVGFDGDMLTMSIRGGAASVAASRMDSTVRIVCRNFKEYTALGTGNIFTDSGCITEESRFSPYVGERCGLSGLELKAGVARKTDAEKEKEEEPEEDKGRPVGKYRLRTFIGYLGGLISAFISKPEKHDEKQDEARTTKDTEPIDIGLLQLNVNDSGKVMFRSAGGFVLERSDRIPVPVRIRDPEDPAGIDADDIDKEDIDMFDPPEDSDGNTSPHYAALALSDKLAYDYKQTYERFIEHISSFGSDGSSGAGGSAEDSTGDDFYLRNEKDLDPLKNDAGIPDRKVESDDFENATGRRAGIYTLPDGQIIVRDGWGSEIIMGGGNIVFNAVGNVMLNPGHTFVVQAGDDAVIKARNSVDIDANEHDVTIKADAVVRVAAGSDQSPNRGGIVLESLALSDEIDFSENQGEESTVTGIVIKANNAHVTVAGKDTLLSAKDELRVVTGSAAYERDGTVTITSGNVGINAQGGTVITSGRAGMIVAGGAACVAGDSVVCAGADGVLFASSGNIGVPIWMESKANFVNPYLNRLKTYSASQEKDEKNAPVYVSKLFERHLFSYRTSEQCHTWEGSEITDTPEQFTLYQPFWSVLADLEVGTLKDVKTEKLEQHSIDGLYPWPGKDAFDNGNYAKLDEYDETKEMLNSEKVSVKVKTKDKETKKEKEEEVDFLYSKDFDKIQGGKNDEKKLKIKLESLSEYIVPVIQDQKFNKNERNTNN